MNPIRHPAQKITPRPGLMNFRRDGMISHLSIRTGCVTLFHFTVLLWTGLEGLERRDCLWATNLDDDDMAGSEKGYVAIDAAIVTVMWEKCFLLLLYVWERTWNGFLATWTWELETSAFYFLLFYSLLMISERLVDLIINFNFNSFIWVIVWKYIISTFHNFLETLITGFLLNIDQIYYKHKVKYISTDDSN